MKEAKEATVFPVGWSPATPDTRPPLNEGRLSDDEKLLVGGYLENGVIVARTTARGVDILAGDAPVVPATIRTDGEYVWTGAVTYYVQTYGVAPNEEFLQYLRDRGYEQRIPSKEELDAAMAVFRGGRRG